jgi:hypothetical protein
MANADFADKLTEERIPLERILLDPNNPRLIGIDDYAGIVEERSAELDVQSRTLARLNAVRAIDQESLRASIEQSGLLPVDRVVVRPSGLVNEAGEPLFIVVEGNRRIAACKTLVAQHATAEKTLSPRVLDSISAPDVLVLQEVEAEEARLQQWVIQGVRHISGLKPWGAYQSAKAIEAMLEKLGYTEQEVAGALSISVQRVRRSMRVLSALEQMAESEDFSEYSGPSMYAYFDEVLKRPKVRNWLGWSEETSRFLEDDNIESFYSWITPDDELENGGRRIPVAENVRSLDSILEDPAALNVLNTPGQTIDDASKVAAPTAGPNWIEPLRRAITALDAVPIGDLENLDADARLTIERIVELGEKRLNQADAFAV